MNRRKFLQLTNTIFLGATGAAFLPLAALTARRTPYIDEIDQNYRALRERIIELAKAGYEVERWELRAPHDGFRFVRAYVKNGSLLTWYQPWCGENV